MEYFILHNGKNNSKQANNVIAKNSQKYSLVIMKNQTPSPEVGGGVAVAFEIIKYV